jgi:hypothetical protein
VRGVPESSEQVLSTIALSHKVQPVKFPSFRIALNCLTHVNWLFSFDVVSTDAKIGVKSSAHLTGPHGVAQFLLKLYYPAEV